MSGSLAYVTAALYHTIGCGGTLCGGPGTGCSAYTIHLEGPFICPKDGFRGAHNARWTRSPQIPFLEKLLGWADGKVKLLTIAAELPGADELARYAVGKGIAVALGHQDARQDDLDRLAEAGATALTHLGNGVPTVLPRHENPIWAGLANDNLVATIIADGNHLLPPVLKVIIKARGPRRCIVISDGSSLSGLAPGRYETLSRQVILDESGRVYDPRSGYMCGSSATILKCMNHLASLRLLSLDELVTMGFYNPLRLIGLADNDVATGPEIFYDQTRRAFVLKE